MGPDEKTIPYSGESLMQVRRWPDEIGWPEWQEPCTPRWQVAVVDDGSAGSPDVMYAWTLF